MSTIAKSILFISTMDSEPWGGSEELWSRAALNLASDGFSVAASVVEWSPLHARIQQLKDHGIKLSTRAQDPSLWRRARAKLVGSRPAVESVEKLVEAVQPALVVHSSGTAFPFPDLIEICLSREIPFVTIGQANHDGWWLPDSLAERLRPAMLGAVRCYFVADANLRLAEKQLGCELTNAEVIRNPFNVEYNAAPPWPALGQHGDLRLASVGRLHPPSKGQDLLFEVFALPAWQRRPWHLCVYGNGPMRDTLERLARRLHVAHRVTFAAHVAKVEAIWRANHVLVMPSRFEGLPLTIVEAMLCARPVIATAVAGNPEVIEDDVSGFLADAPTVRGLAAALERFWARRHEAEEIGKAASIRIRQLVPADPARVFSNKLKGLLS